MSQTSQRTLSSHPTGESFDQSAERDVSQVSLQMFFSPSECSTVLFSLILIFSFSYCADLTCERVRVKGVRTLQPRRAPTPHCVISHPSPKTKELSQPVLATFVITDQLCQCTSLNHLGSLLSGRLAAWAARHAQSLVSQDTGLWKRSDRHCNKCSSRKILVFNGVPLFWQLQASP